MTTYIALLRGINVSGKRLIKMDALKALCATLGFSHIQTYIQSGNIVFSAAQKNTAMLEKLLQAAIEKEFGFEVPVIIKSASQLMHLLAQNPFLAKSPDHLHITFLAASPDTLLTTKIEAAKFLPDEFVIIDEAVYLYCPNGYGQTKLTNTFFETKLRLTCTTRNLKTCGILAEMAANT
jgi:uncharacterized protein (DUF1697 family)